MRSRLLSMLTGLERGLSDVCRNGLNFIKLDGDIGCLGKTLINYFHTWLLAN